MGGGGPWFAWGCRLLEQQRGRWPWRGGFLPQVLTVVNAAVVGILGKVPWLLPHPFK